VIDLVLHSSILVAITIAATLGCARVCRKSATVGLIVIVGMIVRRALGVVLVVTSKCHVNGIFVRTTLTYTCTSNLECAYSPFASMVATAPAIAAFGGSEPTTACLFGLPLRWLSPSRHRHGKDARLPWAALSAGRLMRRLRMLIAVTAWVCPLWFGIEASEPRPASRSFAQTTITCVE